MMKSIFKTFVLFFVTMSAHAQQLDSIGIPMGYKEFKCLVSYQMSKFDNNDSMSVDDAIIQTRLFNTLDLNREIRKDSINGVLYKKFLESELTYLVKLLGAKRSKGYSFYSLKYDLYIGGMPHKNSQYFIVDK